MIIFSFVQNVRGIDRNCIKAILFFVNLLHSYVRPRAMGPIRELLFGNFKFFLVTSVR